MITVGKINADRMFDDLYGYGEETGRTYLELMRTAAKGIAVQLAYHTKPIGLAKTSRDHTVASIDKNLNRLFASPGSIHQALIKTDAPAAAEFWHAHKNNKKSLQEKIIRRTGLPIRFDEPTGTSAHQREVPQKHFVRTAAAKNRYRKAIVARVGRAKAGWAHAAQVATGGHRGIPAWAGANKHPDASGTAVVREDPIRPLIILRNTTPHIRQILSQSQISTILQVAGDRFLKHLKAAITGQSRATRRKR
jgi:hypothetical protein